MVSIAAALILFVGVPRLARGATVGQIATRVRPVDRTGAPRAGSPRSRGPSPVLAAALGLALTLGNRWLTIATIGARAATAYLGFLFVAFLVYGQWYARRAPQGPADAVVVLGSRVFGDRVPPLLAARIDGGIAALGVLDEADPESAPVLVCSGGQGPDETMPEGLATAAYAVADGAPAERVLAETESRTTQENLILSRRLLAEHGVLGPIVVVTNDFHAFRAAIISREVDIPAQVIGAPTARYYFPAAVIREFIGVLARTPILHAVCAGGLALVGAAGAALIVR